MTARKELEKRHGTRFRCRGRVECWGTKPGYNIEMLPTILVCQIVDATTGALLTDHLWFTAGKWSENLDVGDIFEFDARVGTYIKGYRGHLDVGSEVSVDWNLQRPTRVVVIEHSCTPAPSMEDVVQI